MATTVGSIITRYPTLDTGKELVVIGTLAFSGNYSTGGVDISATFKTADIKTTQKPDRLTVEGIGIYIYQFDRANNKLLIRDGSSSNAQIAASTLPAGVTGDTVSFTAWFPKSDT
jgi:hypothetical protein